MKTLAGLLIGFSVVVVLTAALFAPREPQFDPVKYEQQQIAIEQARALAPYRTAAAVAWIIVPLLGATVGMVVLAALGGAAIYRRFHLLPYAVPNERGQLPVLLADQATARDSLLAAHAVELARASIQPVPVTLHYAPHTTTTYSPHHSTDRPGTAMASIDQPARALPGVIDLAQLAHRPTPDSILLALADSGERITVPARALCHVALVGATNGGKSNLLRLIVPQLQAMGAQVCLADPHFAPYDVESGEDWRPIVERLHMAPAVTADAIGALLDNLTDELDKRIELRRQGQRWGKPLFLAMDELPVIADQVPGSADRLARLLREGRKVWIYAIGASQSFLVKLLGGDSSARECYRTTFYVGGDLRSATALLDLPHREIAEGALGQGVAYLRSAATAPAQLVRVPLASNAGVAQILGYHQATNQATNQTDWDGPGMPDGSLTEAKRDQATRASVSPEAARVVQLFRDGLDLAQIVAELRGINSNQGRRYQEAAKEVQQLLREAL